MPTVFELTILSVFKLGGIEGSPNNTGTHLLIEIIDASWKANAHYNGVCMRRGDCYVCVIHFL